MSRQADDGAALDPQGFVKELGARLTRFDQVFGVDPATVAQRLSPHIGTVSQCVGVLASAMVQCVEEATGDDDIVANVPDELVASLQRLADVVSAGRRPSQRVGFS